MESVEKRGSREARETKEGFQARGVGATGLGTVVADGAWPNPPSLPPSSTGSGEQSRTPVALLRGGSDCADPVHRPWERKGQHGLSRYPQLVAVVQPPPAGSAAVVVAAAQ